MFKSMIALLGLVIFMIYADAENPAQISSFRFGADERIRQEYFDHIPLKNGGYARGGENNYMRYRTRLWSEWDLSSDWTLRVRATSEIRTWMEPDVSSRPERSTYEYPDELVFDNLYLEKRNLFDSPLDLRLGRQDLKYGTGKVIFDGTPGDGSRTIYFNAVKLTCRINPENNLDIFYIYNKPKDDLAINTTERDLTVYPRALKGVTESGGGLYFKNNSIEKNPFEAYLIYKNEQKYDERTATGRATYGWQELDSRNHLLTNPSLNLFTLGGRWMPQWSATFGGNLELAYQMGERGDENVSGWMMDASLKNAFLPDSGFKPAVEYGVYSLSGDKPATAKDEGWNPLWSRMPQFSELYVFSYDTEQSAARWSNLIAPHVDLTASNLIFNTKTTLSCYYLRAMEDDGIGNGKNRGMLYIFKDEFILGNDLLLDKDKLTGLLLVEVLEPGNYYTEDKTGMFVRGELSYSF